MQNCCSQIALSYSISSVHDLSPFFLHCVVSVESWDVRVLVMVLFLLLSERMGFVLFEHVYGFVVLVFWQRITAFLVIRWAFLWLAGEGGWMDECGVFVFNFGMKFSLCGLHTFFVEKKWVYGNLALHCSYHHLQIYRTIL